MTTVVPRRVTRPALQISSRLVHYPLFHSVVKSCATIAWRDSLSEGVGAKPSLIHSIGCGRDLLGYVALAEARRRAIPFTIFPAVHIGSWGDSDLDLDLYKRADAVFVATDAEREHLESLGVPPDQVFCCTLGPDTPLDGDGLRFRARHGLRERPIILFVGRKSRSKGYHNLRNAMPALAERVPGAVLVVIGADAEPPYPDLPADLVVELGTSTDAVKADALAACNVFCLPSSSEAFGIAYVEAWAYEKPVIALDTPASRGVIGNGTTGLLVESSTSDLVDSVSLLLSDAAMARSLGRAGFRLYETRYNWNCTVATHLSVFDTVLSRRRRDR